MVPVFRVSDVDPGETSRVLGAVTRTTYGRETWVGDGWIGFLRGGATVIAGCWLQRIDLWVFVPDNPDDVEPIRARIEWEVFDGYWGERVEIVLDSTRQWHKARFQPTGAVRFRGPDGVWLGEVADSDNEGLVKDGWDHEHCAICWKTIALTSQPEGYVSEQGNWVCESCYTSFVEPGSLAFMPGARR